jgi:hypothetical protein
MENENPSVKHGTYASYTNRKCRCDECKTAAREYMREYRKTDSGRERSRLYTHIATKRSNKAAAWVKENHPDVWEKICSEITSR